MWIPESIYSKLPALYIATGAALVPAFGFSVPSLFSALLLFTAGGLTALWRYRHRTEQAEVDTGSSLRDEWAQRRERRRQAAAEQNARAHGHR